MTSQAKIKPPTSDWSGHPVRSLLAIVLLVSVVIAAVGAVGVSTAYTGDAGAVYLGYKYQSGELDSDSMLAGGSALLGGTSTAASGAATYVSASGSAALLGAGAATTGGLLAL